MQSNIQAVLDIGSNSVRLFVVRWDGEQAICLRRDKITSRLLSGLKDGVLAPQSIERTARAIEQLAREAREIGASEVFAFGTSAMRDGRNREELIARGREIGVPIDVLSGEEEADMAYAGAAPEGRCGVIDVGGGSTELLSGRDGRRLAAKSVNIGAVRLFEAMQGRAAREEMLSRAREALLPAIQETAACPVDRWIGVGGTVTSLAAMELRMAVYQPEIIEGYVLTAEATAKWHETLCGLPVEARREIVGLNPQRADIMPYGAAIVRAFFELSGREDLSVSDQDNLLGYLKKIRGKA